MPDTEFSKNKKIYLKIWVGGNSSLQNRLVEWGLSKLYKHYTYYTLSNVGLNPPLQTQQNEDVRVCNERQVSDAIRLLGADHNECGNLQSTLINLESLIWYNIKEILLPPSQKMW